MHSGFLAQTASPCARFQGRGMYSALLTWQQQRELAFSVSFTKREWCKELREYRKRSGQAWRNEKVPSWMWAHGAAVSCSRLWASLPWDELVSSSVWLCRSREQHEPSSAALLRSAVWVLPWLRAGFAVCAAPAAPSRVCGAPRFVCPSRNAPQLWTTSPL